MLKLYDGSDLVVLAQVKERWIKHWQIRVCPDAHKEQNVYTPAKSLPKAIDKRLY